MNKHEKARATECLLRKTLRLTLVALSVMQCPEHACSVNILSKAEYLTTLSPNGAEGPTPKATVENNSADFSSEPIPDSVFRRMQGKSYKKGCTVKRSDLRYLHIKHYTIDGTARSGEIVCDKSVSQDLIEIFRALYKARYPIERVALVDDYDADDTKSMRANNTSCFNYRRVAGSKTLSAHSRGTAVDINPLYNPHVKKRSDGTLKVNPPEGARYADRSKTFSYKIDRNDLCYKLFTAHGFRWGGNWRHSKDYQHFEK